MSINRRELVQGALGAFAAMGFAAPALAGTGPDVRAIPATGELIPAVGLGSWITFNVGEDPVLRDESAAVIDAFLRDGGGVIDSSPMYGSAQAVIGHGLARSDRRGAAFAADKVWTDAADGPAQIAETGARWGRERFDLLQVHNLMDWEAHLPLLFEMKAAGRVRYVGITTSHGRRHDAVERIMRAHPIDFVQLTYNAADRAAEERLLPLARDRGIGVIANRPFQRGHLTSRLETAPLPDWAGEIGASSWAQLLLGFVLSHPDITVAIPATTRVDHVRENKAAGRIAGWTPDLRARIAARVRAL